MTYVYPLDATSYTAEPLGAYNGTRTRGVFSANDCFTITALGGRNISVSSGIAWLKIAKFWGVTFLSTEPRGFTVDLANGALSRYVAITLQIDKVANKGDIILKYGELSSTPIKVLPIQTGELYEEIIVSQILQRAGSVEITAADITDLRLNGTYCGIMRDGVTGIPTQQLQTQADALINQLNEAIKTSLSGALPNKSVTTAKFADDALAPFANNGYFKYTHTKTGTTHKLTGTGANIKFTATASFTLGDTFTVNNVAVTAKNLIGFASGDIVACFVNGNVLDFGQHYYNGNISSVEHWTGIYHIDGKKIYEKTMLITGGGVPKLKIVHGISNIGDFATFAFERSSITVIGDNTYYAFQSYEIGAPDPAPTYSSMFRSIDNTYINAEIFTHQTYTQKVKIAITIQYTCTDR